jgi:hypothetical protein
VVNLPALIAGCESVFLAERSLLEQLDPSRRAAVVMALIGLCLLGVLMVVLTMLAGRWVRGLKISTPRASRTTVTRSQVGTRSRRKTDASQGDTLPGLPPTGETKVDPST